MDRVGEAIARRALVGAINWAEVLTELVLVGGEPDEVAAIVLPAGDSGRLQLVRFDDAKARETARLRAKTRGLGPSLADRAALALGRLRDVPVLTADRAWRSLRLSIRIEVIR